MTIPVCSNHRLSFHRKHKQTGDSGIAPGVKAGDFELRDFTDAESAAIQG